MYPRLKTGKRAKVAGIFTFWRSLETRLIFRLVSLDLSYNVGTLA